LREPLSVHVEGRAPARPATDCHGGDTARPEELTPGIEGVDVLPAEVMQKESEPSANIRPQTGSRKLAVRGGALAPEDGSTKCGDEV